MLARPTSLEHEPNPKEGGDDYDDDFIPDELVALSTDEDAQSWEGETFFSDVEDGEHVEKPKDEVVTTKKRKRREKEKQRKAKKRKLVKVVESSEADLFAQSPHELVTSLSLMQSKALSDMSSLELEDVRLPEKSIADTTQWTNPRNLEHLPEFIAKVLPTLHTRLGQKSKANGAPTLIFVASAALRVADITRALKHSDLRGEKGGEVAKLFARHCKLEEHAAYLTKTKIGAAVGTPARLGSLLDNGALSTSALSHIMLDVTFRDAKKRSLLDIPETRDEVFRTVLGFPAVREAARQGKIQIALF